MESPPSSSWWFSLSPSRCTISKKEPCRDCGRLRVQGASPHAAACVRLRPCQCRARHKGDPGLARSQVDPAHGAIHRTCTDSVPRLLALKGGGSAVHPGSIRHLTAVVPRRCHKPVTPPSPQKQSSHLPIAVPTSAVTRVKCCCRLRAMTFTKIIFDSAGFAAFAPQGDRNALR